MDLGLDIGPRTPLSSAGGCGTGRAKRGFRTVPRLMPSLRSLAAIPGSGICMYPSYTPAERAIYHMQRYRDGGGEL